MPRTTRSRRLHLLAAVGLLLPLTACGLGTAGGRVPDATLSGALEDAPRLDGVEISVGSKNFSENVLLGKMTLILLKAAGADVEDLTNIPGSAAARRAGVQSCCTSSGTTARSASRLTTETKGTWISRRTIAAVTGLTL